LAADVFLRICHFDEMWFNFLQTDKKEMKQSKSVAQLTQRVQTDWDVLSVTTEH
jgi:hypothetical protein